MSSGSDDYDTKLVEPLRLTENLERLLG